MRKLLVLLVALAATLGVSVSTSGSASALGGEWLGCRMTPSTVGTFSADCGNNVPASSYRVTFGVQNETAPSTYSWSIPAAYESRIYSGCSSTTNSCVLTTYRAEDITVSVTLTQGGSSATLTSTASIEAFCGQQLC
jgi:hypothetical protein